VGYIFVANVVTSVLTLLLLTPHFLTALKIKPDLQLLKKLLRYSAPILVLGIAGIFNQTADKILFPFLFDDKNIADQQLGIYGACFKIAVVMVMFIQAFRYAYEPIVFANAQQDNKHEAYAAAMKYFIIFALLIFTGVAFSLDILKLLVQPDYYPGLKVVPIVMVGEIFFGVYFNLSVWYKLTDKTTWGAVFSIIGSVVTVAIIITAVPIYGFIACAYASLISNIIMTSLSYAAGQKVMPIKYDVKSAATYSIITVAVYALGMFPTIPNVTLRLAYRAALWIAFAAFTVYREQAHLHLPIRKLLHLSKK
jgi:O-antigen/teichoic acid export membrane protein